MDKSIFDMKQNQLWKYIDKNFGEILSHFENKPWQKVDTKHFETDFLKSYNQFVDGNRDKFGGLHFVEELFHDLIMFVDFNVELENYKLKIPDDKLSEIKFERLMHSLETGNIIDAKKFSGVSEKTDINTGDRIYFGFKNFVPDIYIRKFNSIKKVHLSEVEEIKYEPIIEMEIEFKTGNLLVCDFFRTDGNEFAEICKEAIPIDGNNYDICTTNGKINITNLLWKKLNMIEFHATNTSSTVVVKDGNLYVMRPYVFEKRNGNILPSIDLDITEKEFNMFCKNKTISNDRWTTCIIEKEQLLNLLAEKNGKEKAQELVDGLMNDRHYKPIEIKIEPGTYYMYMDRNYNINDELSHEKNDVHNMNGIDFLLSREKLDLSYFEPKNNRPAI